MQRAEVTSLEVKPRGISDPLGFILSLAHNKRVLNVGAAGGVEYYLPDRRELWLHHNLASVARELVGIDIDADSIAFARRHGVELVEANCESGQLGEPFDLIVMSDVIEHLNAPVSAISNLLRHLSPGGELLVTTPNPTHYGVVLRAWVSGSSSVYYDHVTGFMPEHLQAICNRLGNSTLVDLALFSHMDRRTHMMRVKSSLARLVGKLFPRCHGSYLVRIRARERC